jgi:hypothetical protein
LLNASLTAEDLRQLCYDEFKSVYQKLAEETGKSKMISYLIEYCDIQMQMERLLNIVQKRAPAQYARFANDLFMGEAGTEVVTPPAAMPDEIEHLKSLLFRKTRELHDLQGKAAQFGALYTPPYISMQIEDVEKEIAEIRQRLDTKG